MINTQLHNQLIEQEIQRKVYEAQKRVQEAKMQVLKERLRQALYIVGFLFIVLILLIILYRIFPNKIINCLEKSNNINTAIKSFKEIKQENLNHKKSSTKPFNGVEYVKENNYVYKLVYKNGVLIQEIKLAPTIIESIEQKHEKIPQFSTIKKDKDAQ